MYYLARVKVATDNGKKVTWKKEISSAELIGFFKRLSKNLM